MLKKKSTLFLLLAVNVVVWAYFISLLLPEKERETVCGTGFIPKIAKQKQHMLDTIVNFEYDDPFLKGRVSKQTNLNKGNRGDAVVVNKPISSGEKDKTSSQMELKICYVGLIKNKSTGVCTGLVLLNGESKIIKPNECIGEYLFKTFSKDSMIVSKAKKTYVIKKI